jgi:IS1 family transposase
MANVMSIEKRNTILRHLVEGNSIRSTCRLMGSQIHTVLRQLEWAGEHCGDLLFQKLQGLHLRHVECDEIWTYCGKKQARLTTKERETRPDIGDVYLFTAQDQDTRLIACHLLGKRSADNARRFMVRLRGHLAYLGIEQYPTIQVSTDGFPAYPEAVDLAFGTVARYGIIIKQYRNAKMQYDPSEMVGTKRRPIRGYVHPRMICTSHCERNNLTIRTFMRRFTRLALGFSRKIANLEAAVNLHVAYFNFCWCPGEMKISPAQAAGIADHVWTFDELLSADGN